MYKTRQLRLLKIVKRVISAVLVGTFFFTNSSFADNKINVTTNVCMLVPPLATNPPCEVKKNDESGKLEVKPVDKKLPRAVTFQNRWAYIAARFNIAEALIMQLSEHTLKHNILEILKTIKGDDEMFVQNIDFENLKEIKDESGKIIKYSVPLKRNNMFMCNLVYSLKQYGETDQTILLPNGTTLYLSMDTSQNSSKPDKPWIKNENLVRIVTALASFDHATNVTTDVVNHLQSLSLLYGEIELAVLTEKKLEEYHEPVKEFYSGFVQPLKVLSELNNKAKMLISGELTVKESDILDWKEAVIVSYKMLQKYELKSETLKKSIMLHLKNDEIENVETFGRYFSMINSMLEDRILLMEGTIKNEIFDLKEICGSLFEYLSITSKGKLRDHFEIILPDEPVWVKGNRISIISLICNLADNAHKFAEKKQQNNARIKIEIAKGKGEVLLIVSDNGAGMTQDVMERIKEPFFTEGGTGVGVTEVMLIAKAHGGSFEIESPIDSGARCIVYLPTAKLINEIPEIAEKDNSCIPLPAQRVREEAQKIISQIKPLCRKSKAFVRGLSPEKGLSEKNLKILNNLDDLISLASVKMKYAMQELESTSRCVDNKNLKILLRAINHTSIHFVNGGLHDINYIKIGCIADNVLRQEDIKNIEKELDGISRAVSALGVLSEVRLEDDLKTIYVPGSHNVGVFPVVMDSFTLDSKIKFSQKNANIEEFSVENKWYVKVNFSKSKKNGLDKQYIHKVSVEKQQTLRELRRIAEEHVLTEKDEQFVSGLLDFFMFKNTEMIKASDIFFDKEWRKNIIKGLILLVDNFNAEIYGEKLLGGNDIKFIKEAVRFDSEYFTNSLAHTMRPYYALLKVKEKLESRNNELEELILKGKKINADFKLFYSGIIKHYQYYRSPYLSLFMINLTIRLLGELMIFNEESWVFLKGIDYPRGYLQEVYGLNIESIYRDKLKTQNWFNTIKTWKKRGVQVCENKISFEQFMIIVNKWADWWHKKNINVEVKITTKPKKGMVPISRWDLIYLLESLFTNAVDAKREDSEFKFELEVSKKEIDGCPYIILRATDNGCGMTESELAKVKIGNNFSTKGTSLGRGNGISIISNIIKNAGGVLKIASEKDQGTVFSMYIPVDSARGINGQDVSAKKNPITPIQAVKEYVLELNSKLQPIHDKMSDIIKSLSPEAPITEATQTKLENLNKLIPEIIKVLKSFVNVVQDNENKNIKVLKEAVNFVVFDRIRSDLNILDPTIWACSKNKKFEQKDLEIIQNMQETWFETINALCFLSEVRLTEDLNAIIVPNTQRKSNLVDSTKYKIMDSLDTDMKTAPVIFEKEKTAANDFQYLQYADSRIKKFDEKEIISGEKINARMLKDTVEQVQGKWNKPRAVGEAKPPIIFALGTSWIKGYEKNNEQHNGLNPLISSIRGVCEKKGITFVSGKDEDLIGLIREQNVEGFNSKVIILAGKDTVESKTFEDFRKGHDAFLAGVDNRNMNEKSYVRIVQILRVSLYLAFGKRINMENSHINIQKKNYYYLFIPDAEPAKYEELRAALYKAQMSV